MVSTGGFALVSYAWVEADFNEKHVNCKYFKELAKRKFTKDIFFLLFVLFHIFDVNSLSNSLNKACTLCSQRQVQINL
uniref:Uncharacterized protein n=1 Tax=Arundo donax TaxID=35708 RepID=A0A0A9CRQ4_ARUDO